MTPLKYNLKKAIRDGKEIWKLECPGCKTWGAIDDDQFNGRISVECIFCSYHKTVNFKEEMGK